MDPNQWAYNQAYRINAAGGIPTNPRFELPFMEQGTPQVQGTAVHPSLAQSRGLGALPNYGHPAFGTVSQFLENMQSLGTPIAGTTSGPYKTVTVGQPAYTLETPPRTTEQRLLSTPSNPVTSISPPKTWELSSFIPSSAASSNPFSGLPQDLATFNSALEPPPAHSRNPPSTRASTIQRNPYQKEYMDPPLLPVTAHSGVSRSNQGGYSSLAVEREPPVAHSHGNQFCSYGPQQISSGNSHQRSHQSSHLTSHQTPSMRSSTMTSNYPSSPQLAPQQQQQQQQHQQSVQETYSYGRGISNNTFVDTKLTSHIDTSPSLSYEAVSPAGTPTLTSDSAGRDSFTPMSLQDLADISSNQERLPLQRQQQSQTNTVTTWAGGHNLHQLPKQQESQSALSSPHSHLGSPHMVMSEHSPLHQPSPNNHINVGSPQVGMSLGSPQSGSSSINPPPIVTAVPDSTTKPRKRSRKKKEEKPDVYEPPISIPQQPVFPCPDLAFSYNPKYTPMNFGPPPGTEVGPPPQSIFMTNDFGNAFVNPNDAMGTALSKVEGQMDYGDNMGMTPTKQSVTPPSPPVAVKEEVDEEFAHLVTPAKSTPARSSSTTDTSKSDGKEEKTSPGSTSSAFQNSFLSFLQGNKPETLSSVTNSNVQRPPMPKYVPDTRPIIPPEPKFRSRSDSFSPPSKPKRPSTGSVKKSEMDVPSVTFSDDEEEEEGKVTKTVASFLDNTSGDEESNPKSLSAGPQVARRGRGMVKNKGRAAPVKRRKSGWDEDDDDDFNPVDEDMDEGVVMEEIPKKTPKKKTKAPSPIPMRERPSRRAKEKVEEKRKAKEEKKKRKLYGGDTDSEGSPLEESSGDEKPIEKDYDSDRDPVWRPTEMPNFIPVHNDSDDDGTGARKGRGKLSRRFRPLPSKSSRSKVRINISKPFTAAPYSAAASVPDEMMVQPVPEPVHQPSDDDEEPVHRYMKGDFVIEKKDLTNYDSYPIWKIDAGRLIQKFEAIEQTGRTIHKALSTYSSWSDAIKHQFKAIKVRILQVGRAVGSEQVEVLEQYRPQASEATDEEEDELMPFFNIYMQILISQALEPGFLAAINEEKDEYYHGPLKKIDALIDEGVEELEKVLNWKDIFKDHVILYPDCKVMERGNLTIQCQVTRNTPTPIANQAVLLAGEAYEAETLEPLPAKTQAKREYLCNKTSIKDLTTYHGLKHYRNATYQNCLSKVVALKDANKDLENRDLLDQCLQNRMWVQKMFRDLRNLTKKAMEKT